MASDNDEKDNPSGGGGGSERPWWQEAMREATLTGLATFFMTEDSIRSYLREKKFPKELVGLLLDGVSRRKEDFYGLLAKEFGRVLGKMDLSKELERFLERHEVKVEAKFSFERRHGKLAVEVADKTNKEKS
jgi:hypothetical protein